MAQAVILVAFSAIWVPLTWLREPSENLSQERAQQAANLCECAHPQVSCEGREREKAQQLYLSVTEQRFNGVRRCC